MPRFAANLGFLFPHLPFPARFGAAAQAGFRAVECPFPYECRAEELATILQQHNLQQVLFNLPPGEAGERGLAALPGREDAFAAALEQALHYAQALRCPRLHAMAGVPPAGTLEEECEAVYVRNLRWAAERLRTHGIRLLIEPLNRRDMPGYFLHSTAQAQRIIERVGSDNLALQMDFYHCQITRGDLAEQFKAYHNIVGHIQIAGVPGRHEPDVGEIHYPYLFDLLDAQGYDGWIGCEYHPRGDTLAGLGWLQKFGLHL